MSKQRPTLATFSEKSSWTPKNYLPSNEKIFQERMTLIKKWYRGWSEAQRWCLVEYVLRQLTDDQLLLIHSLIDPSFPPPDQDFTRMLPRCICLKIFSLLDPQSLCRAAQVCWYWKYLSESNEIWREKCLRLGWFLPSPPPPQMHDYTLWKRHYVACVCQLHWNPPQPPAEEGDGAGSGDDLPDEGEEKDKGVRKRRRRRRRANTTGEEDKKPWRDPDPHPTETHYNYRDTYLPLYSRFPHLRSQQSLSRSTTSTQHPMLLLQSPPPGPAPIPPPTSLLHPTLLEKLRLGSPTLAHTDLSTLNRQQTDSEINQTLYELEKTSPFPKLPAYFVHQSSLTPRSTEREASSTEDIPKAPRFWGGRTNSLGGGAGGITPSVDTPDAGSSSRPPGLDSASKSSMRQSTGSGGCEGGVTGSPRHVRLLVAGREEELLTRAWHIPEDEDV